MNSGENPQSETGIKDYKLPYRKQDWAVRWSAHPDRGNHGGKRTGRGDSLKDVEKRLADMAVVIIYQKTKPVYEAYKKDRNKEKYRAEHERSIIPMKSLQKH